ncbi:hypothetical protein PDESU_02490 [Pontiella desulfatans]|uniref:Transposase IS66 central domain-containing protein n=1 Tax=Pontiella desulfatans TaxID=2750659 RepID=A0A6C2U221_PONDE|nr:hypothetical protein PDESU_02490 [Pontiella desulfatans]
MKRIAKLYRVESKLRDNPEVDRAAYRREHSAPVLEGIKSILETERSRQLPQSNFGKAIHYILERGDALNLYLEHSRLEIDNNLVENAIRPTAIGKKNFLFFGSPDSGQTSAVIYSLIETCRKLGINPADYLRESSKPCRPCSNPKHPTGRLPAGPPHFSTGVYTYGDKPFFMACGIHKPHVPFWAPTVSHGYPAWQNVYNVGFGVVLTERQ